MNKYISKILLLILVFGLINCKEEVVSDVTPLPLERNLVGTTLLYEVSMDDLQNLARAFGKGDLVEKSLTEFPLIKLYMKQPIKKIKSMLPE